MVKKSTKKKMTFRELVRRQNELRVLWICKAQGGATLLVGAHLNNKNNFEERRVFIDTVAIF